MLPFENSRFSDANEGAHLGKRQTASLPVCLNRVKARGKAIHGAYVSIFETLRQAKSFYFR
jgi:hypothetical protein